VTDWMSYCRAVCVEICVKESVQLGGAEVVVELTESEFEQQKPIKGKKVNGNWVFGGFERESNKFFIRVVEHNDRMTLFEIIKELILPGTTIVSDCWQTYDCLSDESFINLQTNNGLIFKNMDTNTQTSFSEAAWNTHMKVPKHAKRPKNVFDSHVAEFIWRKKYHGNVQNLIKSFFQGVKELYPLKFEDNQTFVENCIVINPVNLKDRQVSDKEQ